MAKPRPEKKREPAEPTVLPMELQVGDRLADETGESEVIGPPYTTAGGRIVHARVQRINEPASWEIRSWMLPSASAWGERSPKRASHDATRREYVTARQAVQRAAW